jgi:hypothetical protein
MGNVVAGIIVNKPVLEQWRKLFVMFGIVYFIGGIVFLCFGSAVPRKWAKFQTVNTKSQDYLLFFYFRPLQSIRAVIMRIIFF